jgi:thioredoxin-like negative regulator of GroEL
MKTTQTELALITKANAFTVVHIDAAWDGYRRTIAQKIDELRKQKLEGVAYAYIDCDEEQDYANQIGLRNTPAVAYYRGSSLVSTVIGISQNIADNLALVRAGGAPDSSNSISRK